MKIFVVGSIPTFKWSEDRKLSEQEMPFVKCARDIGYEAALRGHTVIVSDDHRAGADAYAIAGVEAYLAEHPDQTADVVINRSEGAPPAFGDLSQSVHVERNFHTEIGEGIKGTGSLIPNLASLDMGDVMIVIGGGVTTQIVGSIGADRDAMVIAIPPFGGSAAGLYEKLKYTYKAAVGRDHPGLSALNSVWHDTSAAGIIDMAEAMSGTTQTATPHSYFLSYRWENSAEADHVEALLRRNGRMVLRDETVFDAGVNLSDTIKSMISSSDTYIALHSSGFDNSDYCPGELSYATRQMRNGEKPNRVILLAIESYDPNDIPIEAGGRLWKPGVERSERDLSVRQVIESEPDT